jgi:hypothetical protein
MERHLAHLLDRSGFGFGRRLERQDDQQQQQGTITHALEV